MWKLDYLRIIIVSNKNKKIEPQMIFNQLTKSNQIGVLWIYYYIVVFKSNNIIVWTFKGEP